MLGRLYPFLARGSFIPYYQANLYFESDRNPKSKSTSNHHCVVFVLWCLWILRIQVSQVVKYNSRIKYLIFVSPQSVFDGPDQFDECFGPQIGYTIPSNLISLTGLDPSIIQIVLQGLFVILVLHPISAGLSFITFLNSLFLGSHAVSISALFFAIVTALVSTVVFAIDLVIVVVAKSRIGEITVAHLAVDFGNAIWLMLVGVIMTWTAVALLSARACYCCGVRR